MNGVTYEVWFKTNEIMNKLQVTPDQVLLLFSLTKLFAIWVLITFPVSYPATLYILQNL